MFPHLPIMGKFFPIVHLDIVGAVAPQI